MFNTTTASTPTIAALITSLQEWPTISTLLLLLLPALLILRNLALPKPIPGIPYNPVSARRILGDIPNTTGFAGRRDYFASELQKFNSPIIQLFLVPFMRPFVLVADYREQVDVCLRRTKEFDRSVLAERTFGTITPEHHITMKSNDNRFKRNRELIRDLMTPGFLHEISAPQIYNKALTLISLWDLKSKLSGGCPFHAGRDIWTGALDVIMGVAFGLDDTQSATQDALSHLQHMADSSTHREKEDKSDDKDEPFVFPEKNIPEELEGFITVSDSLGIMFKSAVPRVRHWIFRHTSTWKKASQARERLTKREITKAVERLEGSSSAKGNGDGDGGQGEAEMKATNAMDHMLIRERTVALKSGRKPNYFSQPIFDELFGYLVAGHDTSSTTLKWGLKYLTLHQDAQSSLRSSLRECLSLAAAEKRNPTVTELIKTSLPLLEATVEEILRLSRTIPVVVREALTDTTILGVPIEKGTQVFFSSHSASIITPAFPIDETLRTEGCRKAGGKRGAWDAETIGEFRPGRWLKMEKTEEGEEKEVFDSAAGPNLAFGAGPRGCFGRRLAHLELRILVALLVWNFEFLEVPGRLNAWDAEEQLTTQPKNCFVRIRRAGWWDEF